MLAVVRRQRHLGISNTECSALMPGITPPSVFWLTASHTAWHSATPHCRMMSACCISSVTIRRVAIHGTLDPAHDADNTPDPRTARTAQAFGERNAPAVKLHRSRMPHTDKRQGTSAAYHWPSSRGGTAFQCPRSARSRAEKPGFYRWPRSFVGPWSFPVGRAQILVVG